MDSPQDILSQIRAIDENNNFIHYIVERIQKDKYRGWHLTQHNRYNKDIARGILKIVHEESNKKEFLLPSGDWKERYNFSEEELTYKIIIERIKGEVPTITGIGRRNQFNALKKNLFVDFDRMGFLNREPKHKKLYARLTDSAIKFIKADDASSYRYFTNALDNLFEGKLEELVSMIALGDYEEEEFTIEEFMFVFSDDSMGGTEKIDMLNSYRSLPPAKLGRVIELIEEYGTPSNFKGTKRNKRDTHNWKNQAMQIISLLQQTVYFERGNNGGFQLNCGKIGLFDSQRKRKSLPKKEYFAKHKVEKREHFEFHHIIPFRKAKNNVEAKLIDNYRNLVYISSDKHRKFNTKNGKNCVVLNIEPEKAIFSNIATTESEKIEVENGTGAFYSKESVQLKVMNDHNKKLIDKLYHH